MNNEALVGIKCALDSTTNDRMEIRGPEQITEELNAAVVACLVAYWTEQGLTPEQARAAALKALDKLKNNSGDYTWCLLPDR